jgi:hypothetical protein
VFLSGAYVPVRKLSYKVLPVHVVRDLLQRGVVAVVARRNLLKSPYLFSYVPYPAGDFAHDRREKRRILAEFKNSPPTGS